MKTAVSIVLFACLCVAQAQTLPNTIVMAGGGFQPNAGAGIYQASGFTGVCVRTPDIPLFSLKIPSLGCQFTDYFGGATAARIESLGVLLNKGRISGGWKAGAGVAASANGYGGSFTVGGWLAVRIAQPSETTRLDLTSSATAQKDDVLAVMQGKTAALPAQLRALGARGVYRIGIAVGVN